MKNTLRIIELCVNIDNTVILKNISLDLATGDVVALIGPNGAGKSTLLKSLMNHYVTKVTSGDIKYNDQSIVNLPTFEIARKGLFYIDQTPPELEGVPTLEFLKNIIKVRKPNVSFYENFKQINSLFDDLSLDKSLLSHGVNVGCSGGQKKKNEIIQSQLLESSVLLLDEIDAGLDVDATKKIEQYINKSRNQHITIMISHDLDLFNAIKPNKVVLIAKNTIQKVGGMEIIDEIKQNGYKNYEQPRVKAHDPFKF